MNDEISQANKIKLAILEIIKNDSDLAPLQEDRFGGPYKQVKISGDRVFQIMRQNGIDWYMLENILKTFEQEGLIIKYQSINPAM